MKGTFFILFMAVCLVAKVRPEGSLLEMSRGLWTKLLAGGLTKIGKLDPLRVPIIKVDQSEGDASYRMMLRNVEIRGLNDSTLESIHIAHGRLKSNLSELEAGYVSYSDLRNLDSIRYRFHTLMKEPKSQNESFEAIISASEGLDSRFNASGDGHLDRIKQYDPLLLRIQEEEMRQAAERNRQEAQRAREAEARRKAAARGESMYTTFSMEGARVHSDNKDRQASRISSYPADVQVMYAHSLVNSESNGQSQVTRSREVLRQGQRREDPSEGRGKFEERIDEAHVAASEHVETRVDNQGSRVAPEAPGKQQGQRQDSFEDVKAQSGRLEDQPGYIDIVYAEDKSGGSLKRFGNSRIEGKQNARVYAVQDVLKDLREKGKLISHNFTKGESLTQKNDAIRTAIETKRLENLLRYAKNYQEKQGYFEEGMELIYHYGEMESRNLGGNTTYNESKRQKRAHPEDKEEEENVMHVILRIRVPTLQIKSQYQLLGKVGKDILRGDGELVGNFTDLVGDFTLELKKVNDNLMIVRAARAKLVANDQKVILRGMDEEGPVKSILSHGLMAAEAVAAMLADDLATKALSDKAAVDAIVYRMYKNFPVK
ncbi:hypothetical protein KM043_017704 [Ampulex compressa]|nr:hypothetical protein KM043_017704 [Ampulex compressa]